ncbi:hypothetical protein MITS9509_03475 [Synechococcus sp. MIT S9509]|uniref:hypothetical protein n=2 Tax=Synechococcus TaxID=1129 RepID=UPI0007BBD130|nr:hypothetical protein MITS9504_03485 [Synechococcus sp. MIT S9504]KZR86504.1 hypothetical protein MITS9509_03475 [Synechococcus sp. MIT S9509]
MGNPHLSAIVDGHDATFTNDLVEDFDDVLNVVSRCDPGATVAFAIHIDTVVVLDGHTLLCGLYVHGLAISIGGSGRGEYRLGWRRGCLVPSQHSLGRNGRNQAKLGIMRGLKPAQYSEDFPMHY